MALHDNMSTSKLSAVNLKLKRKTEILMRTS